LALFGIGRVHIGLDVGTNAVRAAEMKGGDRNAVVTRFGQVLLPRGAVRDGEVEDPEAVGQALATLWKRAGFGSKTVRVGIANRRVVVRLIEMPSMSRQDLEGAIRFEAQDYIPIPLDDAVMDFEVVDEYTGTDGESPQMRVVVVAAEREMVDRLLTALRIAKLEPEVLELNAYPLIRGLGSVGSVAPEAEAIVDVGAGVTTVVVQQGGRIRFVRILNVGGDAFTQALVSSMQLDWEEAESLKHRASAAMAARMGETRDQEEEPPPDGGGYGDEETPASDIDADEPGYADPPGAFDERYEEPATRYEEEPDPPTEDDAYAEAEIGSGPDMERAIGLLSTQVERFVVEVRSSLDFYTAQADSMPLRAVILTGGGSLMGGLRSRLGAALRLDAELGRVFSKVRMGKVQMSPDQIAGAEPFLGVSVGLALGALED